MSENKWPQVYWNGNQDLVEFLTEIRDNPYDGTNPEDTQKAIDEVLAMRVRIQELESELETLKSAEYERKMYGID